MLASHVRHSLKAPQPRVADGVLGYVAVAPFRLGSILGFNIEKEYNSLKSEGKDKVLDEEYRYKTLIFIKKLCKERGIEFFCAENRFRDMGSSYNCCGVGMNDSDIFQSKIPFCFKT